MLIVCLSTSCGSVFWCRPTVGFNKINLVGVVLSNLINMKKFYFYQTAILLFLLATLNSCKIIGGIFKSGVWVGVLLVVAVIILIIWIIRKMMK